MAGDERLLDGCEACPIMFVRDLGCWECEGGGGGGGKGKWCPSNIEGCSE